MSGFDDFWAIFEHLKKPLNARDQAMALRQWLSYSDAEHPKILAWAQHQAKTRWRKPEYTPLPYNALINQGWNRTVAGKQAENQKNLCVKCGIGERAVDFLCGPCWEQKNGVA